MPDIQVDLLIAVIAHVEFDVTTGCWYIPAYYERHGDLRWLAWSAFFTDNSEIHTLLDAPWCLENLSSKGLTHFIRCINPEHNSAPYGASFTVYKREKALAAA